MENQYEFKCEVGQVVGGSSHSNTAQTYVDVHVHHRDGMATISKRQRSAIESKVHQIQQKTGIDEQMVYRRLMSWFDFESMDEIPARKFSKVMSYLDHWLVNGTVTSPGIDNHRSDQHVRRSKRHSLNLESEHFSEIPAVYTSRESVPPTAPKGAVEAMHKSPWALLGLATLIVVILASCVGAVMHILTDKASVSATTEHASCQYGDHLYSIGSVLNQAGVTKTCIRNQVLTAEWQALALPNEIR